MVVAKDEILENLEEINSTSIKKFSKIDHAIENFGEVLKTDKDQVRSEILSLNNEFSNEIFMLNKSLTNEVNLNRNISKKTEEAVAHLVDMYEKTINCPESWSKFQSQDQVKCFKVSTAASVWSRTMCNVGNGKEVLF